MSTNVQKWHFGVLSFTGTGHLTPLLALAQELQFRGHQVTFIEKPKIKERVLQAGFGFIPIEAAAQPIKNNPPKTPFKLLNELLTLRFNLTRVIQDVETYLDLTPPLIANAGINALIVNEVAFSGPTVAQILDLPYFIVSTSVPHILGWDGFGPFSGYRYSASALSWLQRLLLELSCQRMRGPIRFALSRYRRQIGLGAVQKIQADFPCLAHITQLPKCLDIERSSVPDNFCYAGPFENRVARAHVPFPWHRLDGHPLIYVTLGTTRNAKSFLIRLIAEACRDLHVQLVISLGNRFDAGSFDDLPGNPVVVQYAPQLEILKAARLVITHGGLNTVLETLMAGKPMVAIPLAHDQAAVAAHLQRMQIAEVLPVMRTSSKHIREATRNVLRDIRFHDAAVAMQSKLRLLDGTERAIDIIEYSLDRYAYRQREAHKEGPIATCDPSRAITDPLSHLER
jgi:zeaxanthin glucosyltransferase